MTIRLYPNCKLTLKHAFIYMNVFCVICILYFIMSARPIKERKHFLKFHPRKFSNSSRKTILLWTSFFGARNWNVNNFNLPKCKNYSPKACELTMDRSRLGTSAAVLFHLGNLASVPSIKRTEQIWVLFNMEPLPKIRRDLKQYNGVFNWTSWYRRDSTVPMYYGWVETKLNQSGLIQKDIFAEKTKLAIWVASNCEDDAQRYRIVKKLQQYLPVDTYGECGDLSCGKRDNCDEKFKKYKFVLSFENSHCEDYITEKYWLGLQRNQIPVVYGGADYEAMVPPRSYINVRDFPTISALATYMLKVAHNRTLYNSYFDWMRNYRLPPCLETMNCFDLENYFCSLCGALHDRGIPGQTYTNLYEWATDDNPQCKEYTILVEQFIEDHVPDRTLSEDRMWWLARLVHVCDAQSVM